jgi:hypothetical protein
VVIGGLIPTGTTLLLERRRRKVEIRRAARLIDADLLFAQVMAQVCLDKKLWWGSNQALTAKGWQQYRDVIASELPTDDWRDVLIGIKTIEDLQLLRDSAAKVRRAEMLLNPETADQVLAAEALNLAMTEPWAVSDDAIPHIKPMLGALEAGRAALTPLTS